MSAPELSALEAIMVEVEDLELFPDDVVEAYKSGQQGPRKARRLLKKHLGTTGDAARKQRRQAYYDDLRLWAWEAGSPSLFTFNGIGTRVYGTREVSPNDGSYITTQWLTFVYLPILPLQSYWVTNASEGFYVHGGVEHPPGVYRMFGGVAAAAMLIAAGIASMIWSAGGDADVVLYNGFDQAVQVSAADRSFTVPAMGHLEVELPAEILRTTVHLVDGRAVVDDREIDLTDAGWSVAVYNVAGRGVLFEDWVVYGAGEPPEATLLVDPVTVIGNIDYVLREPPDEVRIKGSGDTRNWLVAPFEDLGPVEQVGLLFQNEEPEAAVRVARAAVKAGSDERTLLAVGLGIDASPEQQRAACDELVAARPESVDRQRFCQDVKRSNDFERTVAEYEARAKTNPDDAVAQYLLGRLYVGQQALDQYDLATTLDPDFAQAHLATAWELESMGGDLERALEEVERANALGLDPIPENRNLELRIRRRLGAGPAALAERYESTDQGEYTLSDMLRLEADPSRYEADQARMAAVADQYDPALMANLQANIAIIGDRPDDLRRFNAAGAGLDVFSALGTDPTAEERAWTCPIEGITPEDAVFCWLHEHVQGRDPSAFLPHFSMTAPDLAATLAKGDRLTSPDLQTALADADPDTRSAAWYAGWRLTDDPAFLAEAEAWAMPPDLPIH